ncbi:MAG: 3-oxoadipate enol-lactonase [Vicinamibacterales bacterium]
MHSSTIGHEARNGEGIVRYQVEGDPGAPPVILINSIGSTGEMWTRQMDAFRAAFRVIRYDVRGHGTSSVPRGPYTLDQLGGDALAVLDHAGVSAAHVCGISLGGITAQWLGLNAPGRVRGLVLANTAARIGTVESWTERIGVVHQKGMSAVADLAMERWFTPSFRERDPETVRAFRTMVQNCPPDGYLGCCAALRDADLRDQVSAITKPTLLIASSADTATPVEGLEFLRERVNMSQMVTLDSAHLSNVECAAEFTAAVLEFLQAQGQGPKA